MALTKEQFDSLVRDNLGSEPAMAAAKAMHTQLPACDPLQELTCPACEEAGAQAVVASQEMLSELMAD